MIGDFYISDQYFNQQSSRTAFYDTKGKRFLAHNNTMGSLSTFLTGSTSHVIDPNNVGLDIIYAGGVSGTSFFGLFKSPGAETYHLLRMELDAFSRTFTAMDNYTMDAPEIGNATAFASSASLANYLFYAVGGKCYVYNVISRSGGLLFDMGGAYELDRLKMDGTELKAAFRNQGLSGKKAGFATYQITTQGGIQATQTRLMEGLFDKIVDVSDKN